MLNAAPELIQHLSGGNIDHAPTPRSLHDWDGPTFDWFCHCCNRINATRVRRCKTCGRSAAYVPSMHLPLFGTMAKVLRPEQAIFLLDQQGFDVNATDSENWTPAHHASVYGNIGLLEVLVRRGARVEAQTKRGWKPLHFAAQGGHLSCIELLLSKKAQATFATKEYLATPLHLAAEAGFAIVCGRLLEEAVDTEARDVMNRTALHLAAESGHVEVVKALLAGGAKADVLDHDLWCPRQIAEFRGFLDVAAVLARGHSVLKAGESATRGASASLPPAPWHTEMFALVRLNAARQRKLHVILTAREGVYATYANIYKHHAAERYARAIEASRQSKEGLEAYRQRVVAASMDAERYRGYVETKTPKDHRRLEDMMGPRSVAGLLNNSESTQSVASASFEKRNGFGASARLSLENGGGTEAASDFSVPPDLDSAENEPDTTASEVEEEERLAHNGVITEKRLTRGIASKAPSVPLGYFDDGGDAATKRTSGGGGGGGGCGGTFVDVVQFNNVRAKFLRPFHDTELSRPYHVAPSPGWRAESEAGSHGTGSSLSGSSTSTSAKGVLDIARSSRTMEGHREIQHMVRVTHRRRSKTLDWRERREWGAH